MSGYLIVDVDENVESPLRGNNDDCCLFFAGFYLLCIHCLLPFALLMY